VGEQLKWSGVVVYNGPKKNQTIVIESGRSSYLGGEDDVHVCAGTGSAGGCGEPREAVFSSILFLDEGEGGSLVSLSIPPTSPRLRSVEKLAYESRLDIVSLETKTGRVVRKFPKDIPCFPPKELEIPEVDPAVVYPIFLAKEVKTIR